MVSMGKEGGRGRALLTLLICSFALMFGFTAAPVRAATTTGQVVNDLNGNGVIDASDAPLASVRVLLVTGATRGYTLAQSTTDSGGRYGFINVPAGTYRLMELIPAGAVGIAAYPGPGGAAIAINVIRLTVTDFSVSSGNNFLLRASAVSPTGVTITGTVLRDDNNTSLPDAGDTPLANVTVQLFTQSGVFVGQTTTNGSGLYAFQVPTGYYQVVEVDPPGVVSINSFPGSGAYRLDANHIVVSAITNNGLYGGNTFLDRRSGVSPTVGSMSGQVIQDLNGNGVIDAGDRPVAGVSIQLFTQLGVYVAQTTTDFNGSWVFSNLPPGFYQVVQQVPGGLVSVATYPGFYGFRITGSTTAMLVTVAANINSGSNNFLDRGQQQAPAISGSVIQDIDGNGVVNLPPDRALPGVQVLLQNTAGQTLQSFTTDSNGAWAFRNLQPGTYRVVQVVPASFTAIAAFPGSGGVALSPTTLQVTVSFGESGSNNFLDRFTQVSPTVGTISGSVLRDANGNGVVDLPADKAVPGVAIQLFTQSGVFIAQTTTDINGAWAFSNIPPGFYRVVEVMPAGYVPVNAFPGPSGGFAGSTTSLHLTAVAGANVGNNNFLLQVSGPPPVSNTISGYAIRDRNLNGIPDGEPGLAGMTVTLRDVFNNAVASTVTGVTGSFSFSGLGSGTYMLTAVPPPGLFNTNAVPGQSGIRLSATAIRVTTSSGITSYPGQLFLAGP